ncbi:MAG: ABC transporter ATP-binding protein [Firmicutes bacterium]|nr:ABC transporter ATP-binding protein [Bacillota bacterium]
MAEGKQAMPPENRRWRPGAPAEKPKNMKGTLRRLWELTKGQRGGLGWILLFSALASASAILSPFVIGSAVNAIDAGSPALWLIVLLLSLYGCDWLVRFLQQFFMASIGQRMILHIRVSLFDAMEKLPLSFFDRRQRGELMSRLTNDVDNISTTISDSLAQLMMYAFTILGVLTIMLSLNVVLTCVALISVVLVFCLTKVITKHTRKLFARQQELLGQLNGQVEESISGLNLVRAFGRETQMIGRFEENNDRYCEVSTRALIWSGYLMPITNVINNLSYVAVAVVSGVMAANGMVTVGMISSFLLYSRQLARPFVDIANIYNSFQTAVAGAERIFAILDEPPEPEDRPDALPLKKPRGEVEFRSVSFGYSPEKPILKDFSLKVPAGTRAAIVGPTGAGKTTVINLLTRFYDVNAGSILLDGHDLREYRLADLRSVFGVVLQEPSLFGVSVAENIRCGQQGVSRQQVEQAAKTAGADAFIRRLPKGYDTVLTQDGAELSQGERQLLTIARAVLADAPILILDEATSSVDTVTEQKIRRAMLKITEGRTSFIIAHRLSTVRDSDRIIMVEGGRITEQGTHEELMRLNGAYARMYRTQLGKN